MNPDESTLLPPNSPGVFVTSLLWWSPSCVLLTCRSRYDNEFAGFIESVATGFNESFAFAVILASQGPTTVARGTTPPVLLHHISASPMPVTDTGMQSPS